MRKLILLAAVIVFISTGNLFADTFNDGGVHDVDYTIERIVQDNPPEPPVVIQEGNLIINSGGPGTQTTVNLLNGGRILSGQVSIANQTCLNMYSGSSVEWADVDVHGTFNMYGGSVSPWTVYVLDNGLANIYGGAVAELELNYNGHANIMGGEFYSEIQSFGSGIVDVYGGIFHKDGFTGNNFAAVNHGTITLHGSFNLPYGTYTNTTSGYYQTRSITGTLESGQTITDLRCLTFTGTNLVLAPVPEPATLLLLGFGGLMLRKKR